MSILEFFARVPVVVWVIVVILLIVAVALDYVLFRRRDGDEYDDYDEYDEEEETEEFTRQYPVDFLKGYDGGEDEDNA